VSGTISGSTIGGSASVSVTLVNTCSGLTVQSAHGTAVAAGPSTTMPPVSETLVVTTVIDTGHPCYVYELELTVSGYNGGNSAYYGNCSVFPGGATSGSAIVNGAITLYVKAR
jgi:hypothetical protein